MQTFQRMRSQPRLLLTGRARQQPGRLTGDERRCAIEEKQHDFCGDGARQDKENWERTTPARVSKMKQDGKALGKRSPRDELQAAGWWTSPGVPTCLCGLFACFPATLAHFWPFDVRAHGLSPPFPPYGTIFTFTSPAFISRFGSTLSSALLSIHLWKYFGRVIFAIIAALPPLSPPLAQAGLKAHSANTVARKRRSGARHSVCCV